LEWNVTVRCVSFPSVNSHLRTFRPIGDHHAQLNQPRDDPAYGPVMHPAPVGDVDACQPSAVQGKYNRGQPCARYQPHIGGNGGYGPGFRFKLRKSNARLRTVGHHAIGQSFI
jgi:hypothetical protein